MNQPSLTILERCNESKDFSAQIASHLAQVNHSAPRRHLALAAVSLAHEHHSGHVQLMGTCHFASAAALLRPLAEASARAHWFIYAASDKKIEAVSNGKETTPDLDKMINAMAKCEVAPPGIQDLKRILQTGNWTRFHKYTHGDMSQLSRRKNSETFNELENINHLMLADHFLLAGAAIVTILRCDDSFFKFVTRNFARLNDEAVTLFDAPRVPQWKGLPKSPLLHD